MKEQNTYYTELINRYLTGNASPGDIMELERRVRENAETRAEFIELSKTFRLLNNALITRTIDPEKEWEDIQRRLAGRQRPLFNNWLVRVAAMLIVLLIPVFLLYKYVSVNSETTVVAEKPLEELILPDGSKIMLRKGGQITWNGGFNERTRDIILQGEAWFEVIHNPNKPFRITAGKTRVEVLGTTFSMNTETQNGTRTVFLSSGKVKISFTDLNSDQKLLTPGQVATIRETNQEITTSVNQDPNILAWKTGHIIFSNTPLEAALTCLSAVYKESFRIVNPALVDCRITATFDHQSVESVLEVFQATLDLKIRKNKDTWEINGNGCPNR
jgi:ferric-dicitrate binding protein FerR (iron transport regulator)